ncbi:MAG TPA: Hpt domain-containing protein, partial [Thermoanaerobaculia bacterium]|nr:Hpt domain-containing protein [Thermoanaerobaculia bacterium]
MTPDLDREIFADFLLESRERLARLEEVLLALASGAGDDAHPLLEEARLQLHTLKGNAGMMGLGDLQAIAHEMEDHIETVDMAAPDVEDLLRGVDRFRDLLDRTAAGREGRTAAASATAGASVGLGEVNAEGVRVAFSTLDGLVDLLGEMVIFRNRVADALAGFKGQAREAAKTESWEQVEESHELLGKTLDALRDSVMRLRMVPLRTLFGYLGRIVHDESLREHKLVRFEAEGGDTPLDRALLELSSEALGHLVRNAVVHGLEDPEERQLSGKPLQGIVRLSAQA